MFGKGFATLAFSLLMMSLPAWAQEDYTRFKSEVTAQAIGSFVKTTTQNGVSQNADNTAGVVGSYRFYFDRHNGVEANYGYTQNTEKYGTTGIETNSHEVSAAYVLRFPMKHWSPFVLAGAGGMIFDPKNFAGANNQARAAFLYGGGADFNLSDHLFVRAEYRGFVYNSPTYDLSSLNGLDRITHRAEPSVGIGWKF
jgi:opacity protein-like surface antigen